MYFHCIIQKYYCASQNRRCFFWRNGCYCNEYKLTVMQFHVCVEKPTEHYLHAALYGFKLHTKTHQHITRLLILGYEILLRKNTQIYTTVCEPAVI